VIKDKRLRDLYHSEVVGIKTFGFFTFLGGFLQVLGVFFDFLRVFNDF